MAKEKKDDRTRLISFDSYDKELERVKLLLTSNELQSGVPQNVQAVIKFCASRYMGIILSRNIPAFSCRDACQKRKRLGHEGIPLFNELKSMIAITNIRGQETLIAIHCRGHYAVDFEKLKKLLDVNNDIIRLDGEILDKEWGMEYGTVNPMLFQLITDKPTIQVFDQGVMLGVDNYPRTMMTNAGHHTWGIEFDPYQLVNAIDNRVVGEFAYPDAELKDHELPPRVNPKKIGIITGNGPDSGMLLWEMINDFIKDTLGEGVHFLGDLSLPEVHVISIPAMGLSMELDQREEITWQELSRAISYMAEKNVDILALACHTTHYFTPKIRKQFEDGHRRFISMAEVVENFIDENQISDFALLGIHYVAELGEWSAYSSLRDKNAEILDHEKLMLFHKLGYEVKKLEEAHKVYQKLSKLIDREVTSKNVIIALTELSILVQDQIKHVRKSEKNIIDALELYAKEIAKEALS